MPSSRPDGSFVADMTACNAMLHGGSRTFFAASCLLPRRTSEPATALYAFCRLADDAIDLRDGKRAALARLRDRLDRAYEQRPLPLPADRAFAHVIARYAIPRALPDALLEGLAWDAEGRRYEDFSALKSYAVRVAGAVGAMMALLMEAKTPELVARACDLGVAMQLTNIARDVGEDAKLGRLYLPLQWLREAGIDPGQWLATPVFSEPLGIVVKRLLDEADVLYERSRAGIARLPLACRPGIHAARLFYAEIGREVERAGLDSVSRRAVISQRRKAWLLTRVLAALAAPYRSDETPCLSEAQYLIDAIVAAPKAMRLGQRTAAFAVLAERIGWLIELFERLERSERSISAQRGVST
jgi:15-cis-phytoene synthase